jgi:hypothetical protein
VFRALHLPDGKDETSPADYLADSPEPATTQQAVTPAS